MKQISTKQAESMAFADEKKLEMEIEYCQADWIKENARYIADVETKRVDKTCFGEWPKGWNKEMLASSLKAGRKAILDRFLRDECSFLDGVWWLGNLKMIEELEKKS